MRMRMGGAGEVAGSAMRMWMWMWGVVAGFTLSGRVSTAGKPG